MSGRIALPSALSRLAKPAYVNNENMRDRKEEYDFSQGARGKFYKSDTQLNIPVYLDSDILEYLSSRAKAKGVEVNAIVNDMLRKDIERVD